MPPPYSMATIQLGFSNIFSPVGNKFAAVAAAAVIPIPSLSLRPLPPPPQFRYPKFFSRKALVSSSLRRLSNSLVRRGFMITAYIDADPVVSQEINGSENADVDGELGSEVVKQPEPCELYVCNLPRSCEISDLVELFKPFGTVISAEISRNPDTGVSRGCGYVTMGSMSSARHAIATLDGSDIAGREMRVRFSVDMSSRRFNSATLNSGPVKFLIYESPYKLYVGNLHWDSKPEDLRNHFSHFGTVVSARLLFDRKAGKLRAYGFLSFSSAAECNAALSLDGSDLRGRVLVVRKC